MITAVAVKEEGGKVRLSALRWNNVADYDTITTLADSLHSHGQRMPVRVDASGQVLAGAKRCEAALRLGWSKIVVEVV